MTREEIFSYALEEYGIEPDYPFEEDYAVLRHKDNNKWFALFTKLPAVKLGLEEEGSIEIMNVKCDEIIAASLHGTPGYFPAYHMNKSHWITLAAERLSDDEIKQMLDLSFTLTEKKRKMRKAPKSSAGSN